MRWLFVSPALLLAACGGGAEPTVVTLGEAVTTTQDLETSLPGTTTSQTPTTSEGEASATECVVGRWELDSEAFIASIYEQFGEEMGPTDSFEFVSGTYTLELGADGGFAAEREEWSFRVSTPDGAIRMTIDGVDVGTYTLEGDAISLSDLEASASVSVQAEVDGELVDLPFGDFGPVQTDVFEGSATVVCSDDELTITAEEGVTSTFTRAD